MPAENSYDKIGNQAAFMNGLYWWGVPTLFRCEHDADPAHCDIALVGVPHSSGNGSTERDQHLGPRAVRNVSAIGRRVHNAFRLDPWTACRINDLGDVVGRQHAVVVVTLQPTRCFLFFLFLPS